MAKVLLSSCLHQQLSTRSVYVTFTFPFCSVKDEASFGKKANVIASLSLLDPACILLLMEILYHCWVVMLV